MTSLDERARTAAEDLRRRTQDRPLPEVGEQARGAVPRPLVLAVAAALVLVVGAVALGLVDRDGDVEVVAVPPVSAPAGIEPSTWTPEDLGVSVQVPDDWSDGGPRSGFARSIAGTPMDAYVLATRIPDHPGRALHEFAAARRAAMAASFDLDGGEASDAVVDGRPASVWEYRLRLGGDEAAVTEYIVDTGGPDRLVVVVGELVPLEHADLRAWIGSTIEVETGPLPIPGVEHPEPRDAPDGVEPEPWEPPVLGLAMDVPADWTEGAPFETDIPFAMSAPGDGPRSFVLVSRPQAAAGSVEARAAAREAEGGTLEASAEVVVDGRPATVSRWRMPVDDVAAAVQVEYGIELDDGSYALVTVGYHPAIGHEVPDWIRSTFRVTG